MATTARAVAAHVVDRVLRDAAFLQRALDADLRRAHLDPRDAAFATELAYGTVRHLRRLDHALRAASSRRLKDIQPAVLAALRVAAYQMICLDSVPASAAVNEAVSAVPRNARGFANALLRRLAADGPAPVRDLDPVEALAIEHSHPSWLVRRWAAELGLDATRARLLANNRRPRTCLRVNRLRSTRADWLAAHPGAEPGPVAPDAVYPDALDTGDPAAAVQDEAAQLPALALAPAPGDRVLDACAAPGQKSAQLAELGAFVVSADLSRAKLALLQRELGRLGHRARCVAADLRAPPFAPAGFDAVLLDAPCSGLGVLRRRPDIKWHRSADDVARLAELQRQLLDAALPLMRPGGVLVYSVCTSTREEGPDQIAALLARAPDLAAEPVPELAHLAVPGGYATADVPGELDGFFFARLRKQPSTPRPR